MAQSYLTVSKLAMTIFLNSLHNVLSCLPEDVFNVKNDGGGGHEEKCSHGHPDEVALQHQALPPVARVHLEEDDDDDDDDDDNADDDHKDNHEDNHKDDNKDGHKGTTNITTNINTK